MDYDVNYCIKKTNILLVKVKKFTRLMGNLLEEEQLLEQEEFRKVLFYDHMFMDFESGEELHKLFDDDGNVVRPIFANTMYIDETYLYPNPTDQDLIDAANLYEETIRKKRLKEGKKLIQFPQKRIY